jgi:hypothetical protein
LKRALDFENLSQEVIHKIETLISEVTLTDVKSLLHSKVTLPEWGSYEKDEKGHYIDKPKLNAEGFAKALVDDKIDWLTHLPELLSGEQRQAFNFGKKLGELIDNKDEFLTLVFDAFNKVKEENRNIELIGGFINGCDDESLKKRAIEITLNEKTYNQFSFYLTRVINPELKDLKQLFRVVDESNLPISFFKNFQYGRALDNLKTDEVLDLCGEISNYGKEGLWTALSLVYMYCHEDTDKWNQCIEFIKKLIAKDNMIIELLDIRNLDAYHWSYSIEKILRSSNDIPFSQIVTAQIIEFCSEPHFNYSFDMYLKNTLNCRSYLVNKCLIASLLHLLVFAKGLLFPVQNIIFSARK